MKKAVISNAVWPAALLLVVAFASRVSAQSVAPSQKQCSAETKKAFYEEFLENSGKDQIKALAAANEYVNCPRMAADVEDVLAKLNLAVARPLLKDSPAEAIPYLIKAASYNSPIKTTAETYVYLADAYERGPYAKLAETYKVRFQSKDESEEGLLALENINQLIDRIIDAYARAVALAGIDLPKNPQRGRVEEMSGYGTPSNWVTTLIGFYEFRHNGSRAGLKGLIATILSRPIPPEPTPITLLPARKK